jgi:peptidylprolyl isomerase
MTDREKPSITIPPAMRRSALVVDDEVVGDGAEATNGSAVVVHYVGVAWSTGKEFDASWEPRGARSTSASAAAR